MADTVHAEDRFGRGRGHHGTEEAIEKFYRLDAKLKSLLETIRHVHSKAYTSAADEVLKDEGGRIDHEKLKDAGIRQQFIDKLIGSYHQAATQALKSDVKREDELETDMLLQAYIGTTSGQLREIVEANRHHYTLGAHEDVRDKLVKRVSETLEPTVTGIIKEEHIPHVVKYMQAEEIVHADRLRPGEAANLLRTYKGQGAITREIVEGQMYAKKKPGHGEHAAAGHGH